MCARERKFWWVIRDDVDELAAIRAREYTALLEIIRHIVYKYLINLAVWSAATAATEFLVAVRFLQII